MTSELEFLPGSEALKCPGCKRENTLTIRASDTLQASEVLPDSRSVAGGLALSKDGHCYYASLDLCSCDECEAACYLVRLALVHKPEVSNEWADKYFWRNEEITGEPALLLTVAAHGSGIPKRWRLHRIETSAGIFDAHLFGPFNHGEVGPGGNLWLNAAKTLVARVWPVLTVDRVPGRK